MYRGFICLLIFYNFSASANEVQSTFNVIANVSNGCEFINESALSVTFPEVSAGDKNSSAYLNFALKCTPGVLAKISFNAGEHSVGAGSRRMLSESDGKTSVPYSIEQINDGSESLINGGTVSVPDYGNINFKFFADLSDLYNLSPGSYSDNLIMTISW
ncbi:hypothetical protein PRCB_02500 [Pantoea rodasii]|uniref:Spore coat protein U/FanG domain-containing protein n=1 Tax=Pantoea rodasii TaxID=1076549 RepID=A0A2M9WHX7_9GAMM|nr:spore coat protein U domain-containing protein [Pantoea rodasii]PJZ07153.1 hypothetical protein PRCB_02500 [Pantoea rodasii]